MKPIALKRRITNKLWHLLLGFAACLVLLPLFLVITHLIKKGMPGLSLDFFTELPKPVGESGGGMRHAILGTLYMVGMGGALSIPIGVLCGIYLSEFGRGALASTLRVTTDLLTGVPSIVVGIFAYTLLVIPLKSFPPCPELSP